VADARNLQRGASNIPANAFWAMLDPAERAELSQIGTERRFAPGDLLCHQGDPVRHVIVLLTGRVSVEMHGGVGQELMLVIRGPGQIIGELAAVDGRPRSANVRAIGHLKAIMVSADRFVGLCQRRPALTWTLLRVAVNRIRELSDQQAKSAGASVRVRVIRKLLALVTDQGLADGAASAVSLAYNQREIGNMIGASRESVVRVLRELRDTGVVDTARGRIVVLRPDLLADEVSD
jgi:CRP-like cAMP-binding protein